MKRNCIGIAVFSLAMLVVSCAKEEAPVSLTEENIIEDKNFPTEDTDVRTYHGRILNLNVGNSDFSAALSKRLVGATCSVEGEPDLIVLGEAFPYDDGSMIAVYARCIELFDKGGAVALVRPSCSELEAFRVNLCAAYDMYIALQTQSFGSSVKAPVSIKEVMSRFEIPENAKDDDVPYEIVALDNSGFYYQQLLGTSIVDEDCSVTLSPYNFGVAANNFVEWLDGSQAIREETSAMGPKAVRLSGSSEDVESIYDSFTSVYYLPGYAHKIPFALRESAYAKLPGGADMIKQYPKDEKYFEIPNMVKVTVRVWGCHSYSMDSDYYLVKQEINLHNARLMPSPVKSGSDWAADTENHCYYTRYFSGLETSLSLSDMASRSASVVSSLPDADNSTTEYSMSIAKTSGYSIGFTAGAGGGNSGGNLNLGFNLNWTNTTTITNSTSYTSKDIEVVKNSIGDNEVMWTYTGAGGFGEKDGSGTLFHTEGALQRSDCTLEQSAIFMISTPYSVKVESYVKATFTTLTYNIFATSEDGRKHKHYVQSALYDPLEIRPWQPANNLRRWTMNVSSYGDFTTTAEKNSFLEYLSMNSSSFWTPYVEVGEIGNQNTIMLGNWHRFQKYIESQRAYLKAFGCSGHFTFVCQSLDNENLCWFYEMDI